MRIFHALVICAVLLRDNAHCAENTKDIASPTTSTAITESVKNGVEWIGDGISNIVQSMEPITKEVDLFEGRTMCRKRKKHHRKHKFLMPLLLGFLLIKSILLPIALKAVAVLSGKAFILSLMSLVLGAIVGLRRIAGGLGPTGFSYDGYSKYRRKDQHLDDRKNFDDDDGYAYYRDQNQRE